MRADAFFRPNYRIFSGRIRAQSSLSERRRLSRRA